MQVPDRVIIHEFPYAMNRVKAVLLMVATIPGECLFVYFSLFIDRGGQFAGFRFTVEQLRMLFIGLAIFGGLVILVGGFLCAALSVSRRIAFTPDSIIVPDPGTLWLSRTETEIKYVDIQRAELRSVLRNLTFLRIHHPSGMSIVASNLLTRTDFDLVTQILDEAISKITPSDSIDAASSGK